MSIVLFDTPQIRVNLLPFTYTRSAAEIRVGIRTIQEKWEHYFNDVTILTEPYLNRVQDVGSEIFINAATCPSDDLVDVINTLDYEEGIRQGEQIIAFKTRSGFSYGQEFQGQVKDSETDCTLIDQPWLIFKDNKAQIQADFARITEGRTSEPINDPHSVVYNPSQVFVEEGAQIRAAIINAEDGPVYLGKDSVVHEGAIIKGAFALGEGSHVNMGAKIKGDTSIGPFSKVGGEVSNSVIFGYSNKGHDGFIGNSVLGEWCNLGADTNTSNLKNNYANVKIWDYSNSRFRDTGLQFCGLLMGDHSKCGINTMFNTGTVVGVGANIYGSGFPRTYIPSFSWGGASGMTTYKLEKFFETAELVMERRSRELSEDDRKVLSHVYNNTEANRK